jgi:hypothetical protein
MAFAVAAHVVCYAMQHYFRVRAMHDRDANSTMRWGNWSETSQVISEKC